MLARKKQTLGDKLFCCCCCFCSLFSVPGVQELKAESRNVELNRRLFHACEQSFSETCPSIAGIVEVEAGVITDEQSEKLLECMLDNREV